MNDEILDVFEIYSDPQVTKNTNWERESVTFEAIKDFVDECIESGYTLHQLQNDLFDEVYEKWSNENEVEEEEEDEDE